MTTVQTETKRLAQEAAMWIERALDRPEAMQQALNEALGKIADIIILNRD